MGGTTGGRRRRLVVAVKEQRVVAAGPAVDVAYDVALLDDPRPPTLHTF